MIEQWGSPHQAYQSASGLGWRSFQVPDDPRVRNHLKLLALATLQLDALRGNAGQQTSTQTAVFLGLARLLEYSNAAFLHFSVLAPKVCALTQRRANQSGVYGEATARQIAL
jgi:hypothetical protein